MAHFMLSYVPVILPLFLLIISLFFNRTLLCYKKEQIKLSNKIIEILDLENKTEYTLYELDKNEEIQNKIMELIPEIRKWFSFNGLKILS